MSQISLLRVRKKMTPNPPPYRCRLCGHSYGTQLIEGYCRACVACVIKEAQFATMWIYIELNARRARMKQLALEAQVKEPTGRMDG